MRHSHLGSATLVRIGFFIAGCVVTTSLTPQLVHASVLTFEVFDPNLDVPPYNDPGVPPYLPGYGYREGYRVPSDYGDRITSTSTIGIEGFTHQYGSDHGFTPNVEVSYGPFSIFTGGPELFRGGYGNLDGVLYQGSRHSDPSNPIGNDYNFLDIVLAADPGYDVVLYGFDLGGYQGDFTIGAVTVFQGVPNALFTPTNKLFEEIDVFVEGASGASHTTFDVTDFGGPLQWQLIWIRIDAGNLGSAASELIGIDNIRFGQVVNPASTEVFTQDAIDAALQPDVPELSSLTLWTLGGGCAAMIFRGRRRRRAA